MAARESSVVWECTCYTVTWPKKIPNADHDVMRFLDGGGVVDSFFLSPVTKDEVLKVIQNLDNDKGSDY